MCGGSNTGTKQAIDQDLGDTGVKTQKADHNSTRLNYVSSPASASGGRSHSHCAAY